MKKMILLLMFLVLSGCSSASNDNSSQAEITSEKDGLSILEIGDADQTIEYISEKYNMDIPSPTTEDAGDGLANRWNFNNEILLYGDIETNEVLAIMFTKMTKDELFSYMENEENVPISSGLKDIIEEDFPLSSYDTNHNNKKYIVEIVPYRDSETKEVVDNYRLSIVPQ